jgi:phosphatidylserine/phosphatidylglycerophosphate/cardiolipin synthase-like enzyme
MRFRSEKLDGFQVFAVAGTNTVSFAITATINARQGLLGFAVERVDTKENQRYYMLGYKVFESRVPKPMPGMRISTYEYPVQAFVWDDFTGKEDREYEYYFHPLRGVPKNIDRSAAHLRIKVRTEKLYSDGEHDVFFNRGVASSQAYQRLFHNRKPDELPPEESKKALKWLSRDLGDAVLKFIAQAKKGDTLLCCFYEFRYLPVAQALQAAIKNKVNVRLIVDDKDNGFKDKEGTHPSFPRTENRKTIRQARINAKNVIYRDANPREIQHNKFMVLLKGARKRPTQVWTGSTNMSEGGISGQTNVGHWVRDEEIARQFKAYWDLLATNPGSKKKDARAAATKKKAAYRSAVDKCCAVPASLRAIKTGMTAIFSPHSKVTALDLYGEILDSAKVSACITLAFGINKRFKALLKDNTYQSHIVFMLLEKKDAANKRSKDAFVAINASNNVYEAWGAYIEDPVYQWARETNTRKLEMNQHVAYIHCKFLLMDPLGADPMVVTGSANFSEASTIKNDENMLIIRGNQRVADIYFTEFNRLFNHYYYRAIAEGRQRTTKTDRESLFLDETGVRWLKQYAPGKLRSKRVEIYAKMEGAIYAQ